MAFNHEFTDIFLQAYETKKQSPEEKSLIGQLLQLCVLMESMRIVFIEPNFNRKEINFPHYEMLLKDSFSLNKSVLTVELES